MPLSDCVRIQSTSGTTGRRVVAYYTMDDILVWDECCARGLVAVGATKNDVVHVCYGYGLFTGGPGVNGGSHMLGSLTIPMSSGNTDRQIQFLIDMQATIIACTPSYAYTIGERVTEMGVKDKLHLKAGMFGAEPWTEEMRRDIERMLGLEAYDLYGLTEISGPGVSWECEAHAGLHIQEDHFIPEIIDPATGEPLPDGQVGELVFTCITKKAFPLLRYRTKDLCTLTHEKCACGRTHARMGRLLGRTDDMMIVKGVNVFPSQIEQVLLNNGYLANYQIVVDRSVHNKDFMEVQVELTPDMVAANDVPVEDREKKLVAALRSMLGIGVDVKVVPPMTIPRSEGKAQRVIDKRKLYGV